MLTLHDFLPSGNGYKCRLLLRFLERPFVLKEYNILAGETRTEAFLGALNANGRIPVLQMEDGRCLSESGAILNYLAQDTPFLPGDPWDRAQVLKWMFFEQYTLEPTVAVRRFWLTEQETPLTPLQEAQLPDKLEQGHAALGVLEGGLAGRDWLVGGRPTIADIALYGYTHVAPEGGYELDAYPNIRAWMVRMSQLPGYVKITHRTFD